LEYDFELVQEELKMNQAAILGVLRAVVPALTAWLAAKGYLTEGSAAEIGAGIITILSALWSANVHTDANALRAVEAMPDVKAIIPITGAKGAVADAVADPDRPKVIDASPAPPSAPSKPSSPNIMPTSVNNVKSI
jgi:hypothetical protein